MPTKLPYSRQLERLGGVFDAASKSLDDFNRGIKVASDPRAVIPERAIVLELLGPTAPFELAAQALGLEWLGSISAPGYEDDEDEDEGEDAHIAPAKIFYLTVPSEKGLKSLLAAWKRFAVGQSPSNPNETKLWDIFGYLKDFRTWSAQDRIDSTLTKYVKARLAARPDDLVAVEVDLWFRSERQRRDRALDSLRALTEQVKGAILDFIEIPEIHYQGVLISIPGAVALEMIEGKEGLARLDDIMRIRPQAAFESEELIAVQSVTQPEAKAVPPNGSKCLAAILDGYPVVEHNALSNRILIKEVDVAGGDVPVAKRIHGTAMASLVVHGDLTRPSISLDTPLAVIPVLSGSGSRSESTPAGKLAIGVIYRALQALVHERSNSASRFSSIVIVNHSICDTYLPFVRSSSPWACLIDYFSHYHKLLFVVSAGNINVPIPVQGVSSIKELREMSPDARDALLIASLREASGTRGLMCPAETINGLSIGALHLDNDTPCTASEIDHFQGLEMVGLGSGLGLGVNRSVKPDLAFNGGRTSLGISTDANGMVQVHPARSAAMGHRVARPGLSGEPDRYGLSSGTSDAAALTTRAAIQIASTLEQIFREDGEKWSESPTRAVILKALLIHSASWSDVGSMLFRVFQNQTDKRYRLAEKDETSRYVGFGKVDVSRILDGSKNRITILGDDVIKSEDRHLFKLPIPSHMLRTRDIRSITITLAWTSPVVTTSADYRGVSLKLVDSNGTQKFWKGVKRSDVQQPVQKTMERGTVTHIQMSGHTLWQFGRQREATLEIGVQAMAKHSSTKNVDVPYALAITLEVAQSVDTKVYQEIQSYVRARVPARTRTRT